MELMYPWVLFIGITTLIIVIAWKMKKGDKYTNGKKVANTKYIKNIPYYKKIIKKYKALTISIQAVCVVCILLSLLLLARPVLVDTIEPEKYNRDIFLCMDVSGSVIPVNQEIVESFKETIKELKGERIGITIFNASSVVLIPLTDDYNYILDTLEKLEKGFETAGGKFDSEAFNYYTAGTLEGADENGSSLIGDGLASCVYNFSNLEEDRARIIILSTDNQLAGTPLFTLKEAADLSKSKGITVYGIGTSTVEDESDFKKAMELTGGKLYKASASTTVSEIVNQINEKEKALIKGQKLTIKTGIPQVPFIVLVISVLILFIMNKRVNL